MEGQLGSLREQNDQTLFWNLYSRCYDCTYGLMPYRKLLWDSYEALELGAGMQMLDAGCGTGNFELFISEKNPPPVEIEAIDFSPAMLSRAKKKCQHLDNLNFEQIDLNKELKYPDKTFDRILSINVLYALEDSYFTLQEFLRVLKPGGKMVITSSKQDFRFFPILRDHFNRIGNIWGFSRKSMTLLKTFGMLSTTGMGSGLLNILVINRRERNGVYRSLSEEELIYAFERNGQKDVQDCAIGSAYVDQNLVAIVTKVDSDVAQRRVNYVL